MSTIINETRKSEESEKLLKQLLESVQDCQKQYGGKSELATEFDACVVALCVTLEQVFRHGLRNKPIDIQQTSTLRQVSEIVVNTLTSGNDTVSFWPLINKHLTAHEQERYSLLKQIWTDTGRSRSWIRSTLNERSLERYLIKILKNTDLLKLYYENGALLLDQEKSSMLPDMAAGLGSILFAINIDKPELNSSSSNQKSIILDSCLEEPIIVAPIIEPNKETKKKKKVVRQIISFDDGLSTSVPSNSGSISSETSSINEGYGLRGALDNMSTQKTENASEKPTTEHKSSSSTLERKISIENSGSRPNKFSTETPESLTILQTQINSIGELTPVSVEVNQHFESPDVSDDILEAPSDISAVLTVVESKNQEEINKLKDKIEGLAKENDTFKEQIKKYISAIQMLKDSGHEGVDEILKGEATPQNTPNYKNEAKIFEKKLVQVAEMHAELMDFNVFLQQSICKKDNLIDRLKNELECFKGPVNLDEDFESTMGTVNVWVPSAFLTGQGSSSHHVYQIFLRAGSDEWNIYRRYAQFHALHADLKKLDPIVSTFDFPPKKSIGKKDSALVEKRRKRLESYLRRVLSHWPELSHCANRFLLEQHLSFFKDTKETDDKNKKHVFTSRRNVNDNHYTGL